jgi:hypothetical protein
VIEQSQARTVQQRAGPIWLVVSLDSEAYWMSLMSRVNAIRSLAMNMKTNRETLEG